MDIFVLIVVIILALLLIAVNIYLVIYFIHKDDTGVGQAILPKIVVVK